MERPIGKALWTGAALTAARLGDTLAHTRSAIAATLSWPSDWEQHAEPATRQGSARILLLTSSLGSGHLRAALALEAAIRERMPGCAVRTLDFWSLVDEKVAWAVRTTYLRLVQEHPELYDRIYRLDQRTWRAILEGGEPPPSLIAEVLALVPSTRSAGEEARQVTRRPSDRILFRLLCAVLSRHSSTPGSGRFLRLAFVESAWARLTRRLASDVEAFDPDVIVATQMNPAALLSSARSSRGLRVPTIGVPTDFGVHDFWMQPGIDRYCLGHESVADLRSAGVDADKVLVTGIPLMPGFRHPPAMSDARRALNLDVDLPVVLIAGGGLGLGVDAVAGSLLTASSRLQLLVITGQNATARQSLAPLVARHPQRLRVWDWTEHMELYIRAADVVVGKPGGLTVAEVLACGRPLIAARALGGQEGFNVRFLERHGVGRLVPEGGLVKAIDSLLSDPAALQRTQERAWKLGQRKGAERIAALVQQFAALRSGSRTAESRR
jgi:UDP-N-acetylglucosamine:LPS N-acetylglucosamine transferase